MRRPETPRPRRPGPAALDGAGSRPPSLLGAALGYLLVIGVCVLALSALAALITSLWRVIL